MLKGSFVRGILVIIAIMIIMVLALYTQDYFRNPSEHVTEIKEPIGDTVVTLEDYKVFDLVDVPFRFVLADIKISSTKPVHFELSRFQSDEGLSLNAIEEYRSEIATKGYDLGIQNVATQLQSNENEMVAKVLIPIKNNYRQIVNVYISGIQPNFLSFNLLEADFGQPEDLGKPISLVKNPVYPGDVPTTVPIDEPTIENPPTELPRPIPPEVVVPISNTAQFISGHLVSKDLILYKGLESYHRVDFASRVRILLINVTLDYEKETTIIAARLNFTETGDLAFALGSEYVVENGNNLLGKPVKQESGYLIFQIDDPMYDLVNQPYTLEVRFAPSTDWVRVPMNQ